MAPPCAPALRAQVGCARPAPSIRWARWTQRPEWRGRTGQVEPVIASGVPPGGDPRPVAVPGLSVRDEAAQLLFRYAELLDDGDLDGVGALLADARIVLEDGTTIAEGSAQVRSMYASTTRIHSDGTPRTHHVITNVIVEPLGRTVGSEVEGAERYEVRARYTVLQATDDLALQPIAAGRYREVVERDADGRLAIVEHGMLPTLWGDTSQHLSFDPDG